MTNIKFGKETEKIRKIIRKEMPALTFVIWDLTPFIPYMHNWRKNIIFIECDRVAVDTLSEIMSREYPGYDVYYGIKKPVLKIRRSDNEAAIVIVASEARGRREVEGANPKLEKCLVDLLHYAKNEILPLSLKDILDLWEYFLTGEKPMHFNELYRYSMRRYLGWFVSIFAYALSKKSRIKIDARHYRAGERNAEMVRMVV
jgi:hypothetical protein